MSQIYTKSQKIVHTDILIEQMPGHTNMTTTQLIQRVENRSIYEESGTESEIKHSAPIPHYNTDTRGIIN